MLPTVVYAVNGDLTGTGVGMSYHALLSASYECVERFLFSSTLFASRPKRIDQFSDVEFADAMRSALKQTMRDDTIDMDKHIFQSVAGVELSSKRVVEVPSACVTLKAHHSDDHFLPVMDSSGSACHNIASKCFENAALEFVERQALCSLWLTKRFKSYIVLGGYREVRLWSDISPEAIMIIRHLTRTGTVKLVELETTLSAHIILALYSSSDDASSVRYACGMGSKLSVKEAVERAVIELYQGYAYMWSLVVPEIDGSSVELNDYSKNNDSRTVDRFGDGAERIELSELCQSDRYSVGDLVSSITEVSRNVAYIHNATSVGGQMVHFAKLTSPDFYLHMQLNANCNIDNRYSRLLGINSACDVDSIPFG